MTVYEYAAFLVELLLVICLCGMLAVGLGFLSLPVMYAFQRRRASRTREKSSASAPMTEDLPHVLVQLPVFNEAGVVTRLLDAVSELDWPHDRLHIQLLDDSSDHTVDIAREKIAELRRSGFPIEHVCRGHRDGFKAEALAAGLARSEADLVAILDADFRPPADWLRTVVPQLMADPRAAFVQSRCEFANADSNVLTRVQGLLLDTHFVVEQAVRARAGLLFQCNGTAAVWRRSAIEAAGGWSGDSLSEDLDLTVRAALAGWHGLFSSNPAVSGLVPERIEHWRVQQRRWAMGFAQTTRKLLSLIWHAPWPLYRKASASFLLLYQAFFPLTVLAIIMGVAHWVLHGGSFPFALPLVEFDVFMIPVVAIAMTLPAYLELHRGSLARYAWILATLPPLIIYLAFSNVEPILAAFLGRNDPFHRTPKEEDAMSLQEEPASP